MNSVCYVGLDVSKACLDFDLNGAVKKVANNPVGHKALIRHLRKQDQPHVVCEATGGYERLLTKSLMKEQIPISVVQPFRVRQFAKAAGQLAKTDPLDAKILTRFGQTFKPIARSTTDDASLEMSELCTFRSQLQNKRVQIINQLEHGHSTFVIKSLKRQLQFVDREIEKLDAEIDRLMHKEAPLKEKFRRLTQVQGVGRQTALDVLAFFPEIGTLSKRQAAALSGLAPFNRDSGLSQRQRSISGGRRKLRTSLYMAALTASRCNPVLSSFYHHLIARGKKPKVALTALMRKLIVLLNAIVKNPNLVLAN